MIKRRDLVDRFEDIVKQEIQNHKKSILDTNVSINKFKKNISLIKKSTKKNISDIEKMVSDSYQEKECQMLDVLKKISDVRSENLKMADDSAKQKNRLLEKVSKLEKKTVYKENLSSLEKEFNKFRNETCKTIEEIRQILSRAVNGLDAGCTLKIKKLKEELETKPAFISQIKKELISKINECYVDNHGLVKQVNASIKSSYINEKKIENLYELINRITKKIDKLIASLENFDMGL